MFVVDSPGAITAITRTIATPKISAPLDVTTIRGLGRNLPGNAVITTTLTMIVNASLVCGPVTISSMTLPPVIITSAAPMTALGTVRDTAQLPFPIRRGFVITPLVTAIVCRDFLATITKTSAAPMRNIGFARSSARSPCQTRTASTGAMTVNA